MVMSIKFHFCPYDRPGAFVNILPMKNQQDQTPASKSFSDFIRNGSSAEKQAVYSAVIKDVTNAQRQIIQQASKRTPK